MLTAKIKWLIFLFIFGVQAAWAIEPVPKTNVYLNPKIVQELQKTYIFFERLGKNYSDFQVANADKLRLLDENELSLHPFTLFYAQKDVKTELSFAQISQALDYPLDNMLYSDYLFALEKQYTEILASVEKLEKDNSELVKKLDLIKEQSRELTNLLSMEQVLVDYKNSIYIKKDEQLEFINQLNSQNNFIQSIQAELLLQNNYPKQSLEISTKLLQAEPKNPRLIYTKALAELLLKQYALAQSDLDMAIQYQNNIAEFWLARGASRQFLQDYTNMCSDYRNACALGQCNALATNERCQ